MIHSPPKQYQVVLWQSEDRSPDSIALKMDFDTIEEARAALRAQRESGLYRAGMVMQWHKDSGIWDLVEQYP